MPLVERRSQRPAGRKMLLGEQPQARNYRLEGSPRRNNLTKNRMHPVPQISWSRALRRVWDTEALPACSAKERKRGHAANAAPRQIDKRIRIPNTAIITRTPPFHRPTSHCMRLLSRCAISESRFAMSARNLLKALSFSDISARNLSKSARNLFKAPFYISTVILCSRHRPSRGLGAKGNNLRGFLELESVIAQPNHSVQARQEFFGQAIGGILLLLVMLLRRE